MRNSCEPKIREFSSIKIVAAESWKMQKIQLEDSSASARILEHVEDSVGRFKRIDPNLGTCRRLRRKIPHYVGKLAQETWP